MAKPSASPFAGVKLTEQTPMASRVDQRLFSPTPQPASPAPPPRNQGSKQGTNLATLEPRNLGNQAAKPATPRFSLSQVPYHNNTFSFTDEELDAIEDLKLVLRRKHGLRATKNDIVRSAIHMIVEDFQIHGEASIIAKRLRPR